MRAWLPFLLLPLMAPPVGAQTSAPSAPPPERPRTPTAQAPAHPQRPHQATPTVQPRQQPPARTQAQPQNARPAAPAVAAPAPAAPPPPPPEPTQGRVTGLQLPRFAALRSDEVNLRVGPSTTAPAEWTYHRRDLPVQIVDEQQLWRKIRDMDGTTGWVHSSTLTGRRTFVVRGEEQVLRRRPDPEAQPMARLRGGVIGRLRSCAADSTWCEAQVGEYRGWIQRSAVWGVMPDEPIGN